MRADAWIEADAVDDVLRAEMLHFGVGVEFVEVGDTKGKVGVGEELDCFGFGEAHEEGFDVFLQCAFLEKCGEGVGCFN